MTKVASEPGSTDQARADAVVVYRRIVATPGLTAIELGARCFPVHEDASESARVALSRRATARSYSAILWLRGRGVVVMSWPGPGDSAVFSIVDASGSSATASGASATGV
jgi:hypothetical protein